MKIAPPPILNFAKTYLRLAGLLALLSAAPAANAMVASVYENGSPAETHNTSATDYVSEIWNRTVKFNNGTGVYLGKAANGDYLFLTAYHVSSTQYFKTPSISTTDGTTYSLSITSTAHQLTNKNGTYADLSVVALSGDSATATYLDSLGSIGIYTGTLNTDTALYAVGTGVSSSIKSSYTSGSRKKQWAQFTRDDYVDNNIDYTYVNVVGNTSGTIQTICYVEELSNKETSFQACNQDSGSGVFVYDNSSDSWLLVGTLLSVGGNGSTTTIGYAEEADDSTLLVYQTFFADLSQYADQINEIMTIPEPSAFGLFAGMLALALAATRRSRRHAR